MNQKTNPSIPSPVYILDEAKLIQNLELIADIQQKADVQIILALKAFALWPVFPLIATYLKGATASSLAEARLIYEEMEQKAYVYAPAYLPNEIDEILNYSSHITFNSLSQFKLYATKVKVHSHPISMGLRVNPQCSVVETTLYDPSSANSRLGETLANLPAQLPEGISGLHFHTLCESSSYDFEKVLAAFEEQFACYFSQLKWVNFGGGHLFTSKEYDTKHMVQLLQGFKQRHPHLEVILEPGAAIVWDAGVLKSTVIDIIENGGVKTAILDISFTAHMPDTLEMPYQPEIIDAFRQVQKDHFAYRLGGISCLAGDFLEAYGFEKRLEIGQEIIFKDQMHYTMVKTSLFNGVKHPSIAIHKKSGELDILRNFGYQDYKNKLA